MAVQRIENHRNFVAQRVADGKTLKHHNSQYDVPVMTAQEQDLEMVIPVDIRMCGALEYEAHHRILGSDL